MGVTYQLTTTGGISSVTTIYWIENLQHFSCSLSIKKARLNLNDTK